MKGHGIVDMVSRLEGGHFYTIGQVAQAVGRDKDTIRRWQQDHPELHPKHNMPLGEKGYKVWLWTEKEVETLKEFARNQKPGRPPTKKEE